MTIIGRKKKEAMGSSGWLEVSECVKRGQFVLKHSYLIRAITKQTAAIMLYHSDDPIYIGSMCWL